MIKVGSWLQTLAHELSRPDGPRVAVFEVDGFDTHAAQGATDGAHADCLSDYDNIVRSLKSSMTKDAFDNTLILTLTEFGRTIKQNSSNGTEHGYGSAILMAGGLLKKAQVHTDWPGLKRKELFEGRDLNSTIDARSIYASAMSTVFEALSFLNEASTYSSDLPTLLTALSVISLSFLKDLSI